MKKHILFLTCVVSASIAVGCGPKKPEPVGVLKMMVGAVTLIHEGAASATFVGAKIFKGDSVATFDGIAVVSFDTLADVEVQPNSCFSVDEYSSKIARFYLEPGSAWIRVNRKLAKDQQLLLKRPLTVASVRGTKFYAFEMDGMQATCECEGELKFAGVKNKFEGVHHHDSIMVANKSGYIMLSPEELEAIFGAPVTHNHSMIPNSPLGSASEKMPAAVQKRMKEAIEKKFREAQAK